jgi:hypothetical protein
VSTCADRRGARRTAVRDHVTSSPRPELTTIRRDALESLRTRLRAAEAERDRLRAVAAAAPAVGAEAAFSEVVAVWSDAARARQVADRVAGALADVAGNPVVSDPPSKTQARDDATVALSRDAVRRLLDALEWSRPRHVAHVLLDGLLGRERIALPLAFLERIRRTLQHADGSVEEDRLLVVAELQDALAYPPRRRSR